MRYVWLRIGILPLLLIASAVSLWGEPEVLSRVGGGAFLLAQADGPFDPDDIVVDNVERYIVWTKDEGRSYGLIKVIGTVTNLASEPAVKIVLNAQLLDYRDNVLAEATGTVVALAPGDTRFFDIKVIDYEGAVTYPPAVRVLVQKVE